MTSIATRLAISRNHELIVPKWLAPTQKDKLPKSERVAFPKPPKGPGKLLMVETAQVCVGLILKTRSCTFLDGSLLYERVPNTAEADKTPVNNLSPGLKKRSFDDVNGKLDFDVICFTTELKSQLHSYPVILLYAAA